MEIVPVRAILPSGQRVDESYERNIMLADVRKDMGFREDEVELQVNGQIIDESTRIADLKLHHCKVSLRLTGQDRVHLYFHERKDQSADRKSKKVKQTIKQHSKSETKLKKPSSQQLLKIIKSEQFELEEKYNFRRYVSNYKRKVDLRDVPKGSKISSEDLNGYLSREQRFLATRTPLFHPSVQMGAKCYTRKRMLENYNPAQDLKPRRVSPEQFVSFLFLIRVCFVLLIFDIDSYQLWLLQLINLVAEVYFLINKVKKVFKREEQRLLSILQTRFLEEFRDELDLEVAEFRQHIFGEQSYEKSEDLALELLLNSMRKESKKQANQSFEELRNKVMGERKSKGCLKAVWHTVFYFFYSMHYGAMENEFQRFEKEEKEKEELMKKVEDAWQQLEQN